MASSISWMPSQGRHSVNIGPSLVRAIKTRKLKDSPAPTAKRSNLPERDFYAVRYNFKPGAIDINKAATIETKKGPENTQISAEFPSKDVSEVSTYNGTELPAKEVDCILIYDEDTGQYTLEKLDSFVSLQFAGKRPAPAAPSPTPAASSTSRKGKRKQDEVDDDLEQLLLDDDHDALPTTRHPLAEEAEEGEEIEVPLRKPSPPPRKSQPKSSAASTSARSTKPLPKARESNAHSPPPPTSKTATPTVAAKAGLPAKPATSTPTPTPPVAKPKPVPRPAKKAKVVPPPSTTDDMEIVEIVPPKQAQATRQPKPPPPEPKPKPPTELSLPGSGGAGFTPLSLPGSSAKKASSSTTPAIPPPISVPQGVSATITMEEVLGEEEEDDEDDWEAVPTTSAVLPPANDYDVDLENEIFGDGFGDTDGFSEPGVVPADEAEEDLEEIDMNVFEAELNQHMGMDAFGDDPDEEMEEMEDVLIDASGAGGRQPISMNKLASGMEGFSEDDYSSSESESD